MELIHLDGALRYNADGSLVYAAQGDPCCCEPSGCCDFGIQYPCNGGPPRCVEGGSEYRFSMNWSYQWVVGLGDRLFRDPNIAYPPDRTIYAEQRAGQVAIEARCANGQRVWEVQPSTQETIIVHWWSFTRGRHLDYTLTTPDAIVGQRFRGVWALGRLGLYGSIPPYQPFAGAYAQCSGGVSGCGLVPPNLSGYLPDGVGSIIDRDGVLPPIIGAADSVVEATWDGTLGAVGGNLQDQWSYQWNTGCDPALAPLLRYNGSASLAWSRLTRTPCATPPCNDGPPGPGPGAPGGVGCCYFRDGTTMRMKRGPCLAAPNVFLWRPGPCPGGGGSPNSTPLPPGQEALGCGDCHQGGL